MTEEQVKKAIRDIPDFPSKGILFKDLTTAFKKIKESPKSLV